MEELCARIAPDLDNCTVVDKRDAYTYLGLKVTATPEGVGIEGYLDPSVIKSDSYLITIEQTSECLPFHVYIEIPKWKGYALSKA